jgi:hypothetical protein
MKKLFGANVKRSSAVLSIAGAALFLGGCGGESQDIPPEEKEAIAVGVNADVGEVEVLSLMLVSSGESEPGRLLGTVSNKAGSPVDVTFSDTDDALTVTVEPGAEYGFDTNPAVFDTVSGIPGDLVPVTVESGADSQELKVPVVDGTLEQYRPYLPSPEPGSPASP